METRTVTATAENGATMEIATIVHEGHESTAMGATIDLANGYVVAYAAPYASMTRRDGTPVGGTIQTWNGESIGFYRVTSTWQRYTKYGEPYRMTAIRARIDGDPRDWHGRYGSDWSQLVRLRTR